MSQRQNILREFNIYIYIYSSLGREQYVFPEVSSAEGVLDRVKFSNTSENGASNMQWIYEKSRS
jgi:hypothetical protein